MSQSMPRLAALALSLGASSWAAAGLLGTQVDVNYHLTGFSSTSDTVLVGAGVELTCPGTADLCNLLVAPTQTVDIDDSFIEYRYSGTAPSGFNNVAVNGFDFQMLQFGVPLDSFTLTTDIAGLVDARITLTADRLQINMSGLAIGTSAFFRIDLVGAPIPEPSSMALLAAAAGALLLRRRPKARR